VFSVEVEVLLGALEADSISSLLRSTTWELSILPFSSTNSLISNTGNDLELLLLVLLVEEEEEVLLLCAAEFVLAIEVDDTESLLVFLRILVGADGIFFTDVEFVSVDDCEFEGDVDSCLTPVNI
jgi:hypothetical protein